MTLPTLTAWENTRAGLHHAAQTLGAIRKLAAPPLPNYAHLGLFVTPYGLTTGPLPFGHLSLDFIQRVVRCHIGPNTHNIALAGHTQITLLDRVLETLNHAGHPLSPDRSKISNDTLFAIDEAQSAAYAQALFAVFTAIARFRARLLGALSPMIVWPHGFDLSFLWFPGPSMDEQKDPHMNFGFSPGSPGIDHPYIYAYVWPLPDHLTQLPLPAPAHWHTQGWIGVVLSYNEIITSADPAGQIETILDTVYRAISGLMSRS